MRRLAAALTIAGSAIAIGALLGAPHTGSAAAQAAPTNTGTPTISGTAQEKQAVKASQGTWTGSPTKFAYAWSRCDKNGDACTAISGATDDTYTLQSADVDHTLRVTVTATNADGSTPATSAPSALVSPAATAPTNTAVPTVSGTTGVGSTLTGTQGKWDGNPTKYGYQWSRCDSKGNSCAAIVGATAATYKLTQADAGTTLRFAVTAGNAAGATTVTTPPTAVVAAPPAPPAPPATGCPSGTGTIQVKDLSPPARLLIDQQSIVPGVVTPGTGSIQVRVRVTACKGRPVQGATLFASAIPYNQFAGSQGTTGSDGFVTITEPRRSGFPAARRQQLLAVFTRATKPGEPILGGVSSRRLFTFPVRLH